MSQENVEEEFVVLASLDSRRAAERIVASFGHKFRRVARQGKASALVVSSNPDGSLKVTGSRVLTGGDLTAALMAASVVWTAGFRGVVSILKRSKSVARAGRIRGGHVGSEEDAAHAILAEAGPHSAIVLVRCKDREMWQEVSARPADRAINSWQASLTEFLAALDPGTPHDWVRAALAEPSS
jgi:hypothetical protein